MNVGVGRAYAAIVMPANRFTSLHGLCLAKSERHVGINTECVYRKPYPD